MSERHTQRKMLPISIKYIVLVNNFRFIWTGLLDAGTFKQFNSYEQDKTMEVVT